MTMPNQNFGGRDDPFVKGDHKQITIAVVDENGSPKNLSGLSNKRWQAWKDGAQKIVKASGDISIVDVTGVGAQDGLRFELTPGDTATLSADIYDHEAEVVDAGGKVSTVCTGKFTLTEDLID